MSTGAKLRNIILLVKNIDVSAHFYQSAIGVTVLGKGENIVQLESGGTSIILKVCEFAAESLCFVQHDRQRREVFICSVSCHFLYGQLLKGTYNCATELCSQTVKDRSKDLLYRNNKQHYLFRSHMHQKLRISIGVPSISRDITFS